jgi:hypothetical protein
MGDKLRPAIFIDTFSSLDALPKKHYRDPAAVLRAIMGAGGRFSTFEASDSRALGATITALFHELRWIESTGCERDQYPWHQVKLTPAGWEALHGRAALQTGGESDG